MCGVSGVYIRPVERLLFLTPLMGIYEYYILYSHANIYYTYIGTSSCSNNYIIDYCVNVIKRNSSGNILECAGDGKSCTHKHFSRYRVYNIRCTVLKQY
jgi:hypothetical protein